MRESTSQRLAGLPVERAGNSRREATKIVRQAVEIEEAMTKLSLEETLIDVWRQSLVDNSKLVEIDDKTFPVRTTAKLRLKQVDFVFEGRDIRGLEQNPDTKSRWAKMAREGKKMMQFLENYEYVAVVSDGTMRSYTDF